MGVKGVLAKKKLKEHALNMGNTKCSNCNRIIKRNEIFYREYRNKRVLNNFCTVGK